MAWNTSTTPFYIAAKEKQKRPMTIVVVHNGGSA